METFRALVLEEGDGGVQGQVRELSPPNLPPGDLLVRVSHSSLNYKDGLALLGRARVVRSYPMVPGIDLAGTVQEGNDELAAGVRVIVTGWGMGETHWGGYTQMERVDTGMTVPTPEAFSDQQAMALGTAGLTAMLAVMALEEGGVSPEAGPVVVSGAAGGVGSLAVAILASLGYQVVASTGRGDQAEYLRSLGAGEIIGREELNAPAGRPLESGRWAGAIDTVGGATLSGILRQTRPYGRVAVCGNAGGNDLQTTVLPFILRGVSMLGIDSNYCPRDRRIHAWMRLATDLRADALGAVTQVVGLSQVPGLAPRILAGGVRGRVVVDVNA